METFYIIFPQGDMSKICVIGILNEYQLDEYKRASRKSFRNRNLAVDYAKELALKHSITFEGREPEDDYLD